MDVVIEGYFTRRRRPQALVDGGVESRWNGTAAGPSHEPFSSALELQGRLAESNADRVGALTPAERSRTTPPETSSPDAYQHYLFGRYHLEQRSLQQMRQAES